MNKAQYTVITSALQTIQTTRSIGNNLEFTVFQNTIEDLMIDCSSKSRKIAKLERELQTLRR